MVKYQIQFKPVNPTTNSCMTNQTVGTNVNRSDKIYMCTTADGASGTPAYAQIQSVIWSVYAVVESVKKAMIIAKPLIQEYGIGNVQIVKVVPASTEIVFEEDQQ